MMLASMIILANKMEDGVPIIPIWATFYLHSTDITSHDLVSLTNQFALRGNVPLIRDGKICHLSHNTKKICLN